MRAFRNEAARGRSASYSLVKRYFGAVKRIFGNRAVCHCLQASYYAKRRREHCGVRYNSAGGAYHCGVSDCVYAQMAAFYWLPVGGYFGACHFKLVFRVGYVCANHAWLAAGIGVLLALVVLDYFPRPVHNAENSARFFGWLAAYLRQWIACIAGGRCCGLAAADERAYFEQRGLRDCRYRGAYFGGRRNFVA